MEKEINIGELFSVILKKWWLIAISAVFFGTVFFLYSNYCIIEQYTSYGSLYVNNKAQEIISSSDENNTANLYDLTTSEMLVDTYKAILGSNNFFEIIKKNSDLPYEAKQLKSMVAYDSIEETGIIQVFAKAYSPEEARDLCQHVLECANLVIMDVVEAGSVKTIDSATLPEGHSYPNVTKNTMLGIILGCMLACVIIFLRYYFDVKIKDISDLEAKYDLIVLGTIPSMDSVENPKIGGEIND